MKYRKLRIAFTVTCGIACVLLVVLWVRSYSRAYKLETADMALRVDADFGEIRVFLGPPLETVASEPYWHLHCDPPLQDDFFELFSLPKPSPLDFDFQYSSIDGILIRAPGWSFGLVATIGAVIPWVRWSKRFSLRTLLTATTVIAVVLGAIIYAWK